MTDTTTDARLSPEARTFLAATRFATIATIDPDGNPRQAVVWYRFEDDEIVLNSAIGRRWPSNLLRDPRVSVAIHDAADGYRWVGVSGRATANDDQAVAQADIAEMARRFHADEPDEAEALITGRFQRQRRITFRVRIDAVHIHLD